MDNAHRDQRAVGGVDPDPLGEARPLGHLQVIGGRPGTDVGVDNTLRAVHTRNLDGQVGAAGLAGETNARSPDELRQ